MATKSQQIWFCTTPDGARIAYATAGTGEDLVRGAHWLTHLELDWQSPFWKGWLTELTRHNRLIRYDERGCGLSDREVDRFDLEAWVADLEAVVDDAGLERFQLFGPSQGGPVAIAYAARHPERVSQLVLYGTYVRGVARRPGVDLRELEAMLTLVEAGWGQDNPAYRRMFSTLMAPEAEDEELAWLDEIERRSATAETAARMLQAFAQLDVTEEARGLDVPTLVAHAIDDARVPFDEGRLVAATIPGARFVPLESRNHMLRPREPAFRTFFDEVHRFLGHPSLDMATSRDKRFPELTDREEEVLEHVAAGLTNPEIARRLYLSPKTVRNYVSTIMTKLGAGSRGQLIARARDAGVAEDRTI